MDRLNVLFILDAGYITQLVAVMRSILAFTRKENLHFVILFYGEPPSESREVAELIDRSFSPLSFEIIDVHTRFPEISQKCKNLYITDNVADHLKTPLLYIRLFLIDMLPHITGWLLHLDLDIIVRHDITKIVPSTANKPIYAVLNKKPGSQGISTEMLRSVIEREPQLFERFPQAIVQDVKNRVFHPSSSFNAGVWILDTGACRKIHMSTFGEICMVINSRQNAFKLCDQSILNFFFAGSVGRLDDSWNAKVGHRALARKSDTKVNETITTAKIFHYAGAIKPWQEDFEKYCNTETKAVVLQEWKRFAVQD